MVGEQSVDLDDINNEIFYEEYVKFLSLANVNVTPSSTTNSYPEIDKLTGYYYEKNSRCARGHKLYSDIERYLIELNEKWKNQ